MANHFFEQTIITGLRQLLTASFLSHEYYLLTAEWSIIGENFNHGQKRDKLFILFWMELDFGVEIIIKIDWINLSLIQQTIVCFRAVELRKLKNIKADDSSRWTKRLKWEAKL